MIMQRTLECIIFLPRTFGDDLRVLEGALGGGEEVLVGLGRKVGVGSEEEVLQAV